MNHNSIKQKTPPNKIDVIVDRINRKIGRILGKKGNKPTTPKKTSNLTFSLTVILFSILVWISTGFYYLGESQFGIILNNGVVTKVVKGIRVGFTYPYPFGSIEIMNASQSGLIDLNKLNLASSDIEFLSSDGLSVQVSAKFSYQVMNPQLAFKTLLQQQDNFDTYVAWQVQLALHDYFMQKTNLELSQVNLAVITGSIMDKLNLIIAQSGVRVTKLRIHELHLANTTLANSAVESAPRVTTANELANSMQASVQAIKLVKQLMTESLLYKQNLLIDTQTNINMFNQLLPQYEKNKIAIAKQMYYDALSAVPVARVNNYPLSNQPLSELLIQNQATMDRTLVNSSTPVINKFSRTRNFERDTNRYRNIPSGDE